MVLENPETLVEIALERVLILVWVEYGLGDYGIGMCYRYIIVLILVWVEYGLGDRDDPNHIPRRGES